MLVLCTVTLKYASGTFLAVLWGDLFVLPLPTIFHPVKLAWNDPIFENFEKRLIFYIISPKSPGVHKNIKNGPLYQRKHVSEQFPLYMPFWIFTPYGSKTALFRPQNAKNGVKRIKSGIFMYISLIQPYNHNNVQWMSLLGNLDNEHVS